MTHKLYRCGNKYDGRSCRLAFIEKSTDRDDLILKAVIEADGLLTWTIGKISYGYRSWPGEPCFAISTHKETT